MFYSPLRYPGGKGKIFKFMKQFVKENYNEPPIYVEPYAGGAAIALGLLIEDLVSQIYINDKDNGIYSFWKSVLYDTEHLITKIEQTKVNIETWKVQKNIYNNQTKYSTLDIGFATFYLNRCNYSGVIKGGPIGGIKQNGNWKLDARYNKIDLIRRIEKISAISNKIKLFNQDTLILLKENQEEFKNFLLYLDPPYFNKGYQLYANHYKQSDHEEIAKCVKYLRGHWVVSYDNVPEIAKLYKFAESREFNIPYSAGKIKCGKEIMFFSPKSKIPDLKIC